MASFSLRSSWEKWDRKSIATAGAGTLLAVIALAWWGLAGGGSSGHEPAGGDAAAASPSPQTADEPGTVTLSQETWPTAGLQISPAHRGSLAQTLWVTGKIALNEDRVAHIFPLVEGRVEQVAVHYGQQVRAGDVLAVVQSKEVGQAKLDLFKARLDRDFAVVRDQCSREFTDNAQELVAALEQGIPMDEIHERFRDQPMGEYREQLLSAYASLYKSRIDFERLVSVSDKGVIPAKQLTAARAARDADRAVFQAWVEQIKHESRHSAMLAHQALQEAETQVATNETALKILGFNEQELKNIDPAKEGEATAHYPIKAPFDGTILSKDVVLMERVSPDRQILQIADLSSVWVRADIYEQHLPLLEQLAGKTVRVRANAYPGQFFQATVFYTGEVVDEASRTVALTATADNRDGRLKPGLFVEIELPGATQSDVLLVPETAVQDHEGKSFVFVHAGGDRFVRRDVVTGRTSDGLVEITDGLKDGEPVAVTGGFVLKSRLLAELLSEE